MNAAWGLTGHLGAVKLLIAAKAQVNHQDKVN